MVLCMVISKLLYIWSNIALGSCTCKADLWQFLFIPDISFVPRCLTVQFGRPFVPVCSQCWNSLDEPCFADDGVTAFKSLIDRALLFDWSVFSSSTTLSYHLRFFWCQFACFFQLHRIFDRANILPFYSCYWHMCFNNNNIEFYRISVHTL